jgi:hypothetical protein
MKASEKKMKIIKLGNFSKSKDGRSWLMTILESSNDPPHANYTLTTKPGVTPVTNDKFHVSEPPKRHSNPKIRDKGFSSGSVRTGIV